MSTFQDFLVDESGDLLIQNGDFVIGPSDLQHVQDIIYSFAGWWKEYPSLGVGIQQYLKDAGGAQAAISAIKQQLQSDGYQVGDIIVKTDASGKLTVQIPPGAITRNP